MHRSPAELAALTLLICRKTDMNLIIMKKKKMNTFMNKAETSGGII